MRQFNKIRRQQVEDQEATLEQPNPDIQRPYLSLDEVADRWGVSRGTTYKAVSNGDLKAKRFGKHIRIHFEELERYERDSDWENGQYRESPMKGKKMPRDPRDHQRTSAEADPASLATAEQR